MANRYGNREYGRYGEGRGGYGQGYRRRDRNDQERSSSSGWRSGGFRRDDTDEEYFGGGRQSYGTGYMGSSYTRDSSTYPRDYEERSTDYGTRRESGRSGSEGYRGNYDRDFEYGYGEMSRGRNMSGAYGGASYGRGGYSSNYPESESGYAHGRGYEEDDRGWWDRASDEVSSWFGDEEAERRRMMDARREGQYRGRGPKNYTRSDDRIKEDINDRLTDYSYIDASEIEVEVSNGDVTLTGTVDSRYDKRMAEDIAEDVSGVKNVENRIRVNNTQSSDWSYSDTAGHSERGRTASQSTPTANRTTAGSTTTSSATTARTKGKSAGT